MEIEEAFSGPHWDFLESDNGITIYTATIIFNKYYRYFNPKRVLKYSWVNFFI